VRSSGLAAEHREFARILFEHQRVPRGIPAASGVVLDHGLDHRLVGQLDRAHGAVAVDAHQAVAQADPHRAVAGIVQRGHHLAGQELPRRTIPGRCGVEVEHAQAGIGADPQPPAGIGPQVDDDVAGDRRRIALAVAHHTDHATRGVHAVEPAGEGAGPQRAVRRLRDRPHVGAGQSVTAFAAAPAAHLAGCRVEQRQPAVHGPEPDPILAVDEHGLHVVGRQRGRVGRIASPHGEIDAVVAGETFGTCDPEEAAAILHHLVDPRGRQTLGHPERLEQRGRRQRHDVGREAQPRHHAPAPSFSHR